MISNEYELKNEINNPNLNKKSISLSIANMFNNNIWNSNLKKKTRKTFNNLKSSIDLR